VQVRAENGERALSAGEFIFRAAASCRCCKPAAGNGLWRQRC